MKLMLLLYGSSARLAATSRCMGSGLRGSEPQFGCRMVVAGAKRRKKKAKRKKKADSVGVLEGSSPSAVPRVGLEATTLSVRAQIREARDKRNLDNQQQTVPVRRQSNPKRSVSASENRKSELAAERRREQERALDDTEYLRALRKKTQVHRAESDRASMASVYDTATAKDAPVVVVDGYNVLFCMRKQKKYSGKGGATLKASEEQRSKERKRYQQEGLVYSARREEGRDISPDEIAAQRSKVEELVSAYARREMFQARVIWDAMGRAGEVEDLTIEHRDELSSVSYSVGEEADFQLGPAAREYLTEGARYAQVVTSDVNAGEFATGLGDKVFLCSTENFLLDMERSAKEDSFEVDVLAAIPAGADGAFCVNTLLDSAADSPEKRKLILEVLPIGPDVIDRIIRRDQNRRGEGDCGSER